MRARSSAFSSPWACAICLPSCFCSARFASNVGDRLAPRGVGGQGTVDHLVGQTALGLRGPHPGGVVAQHLGVDHACPPRPRVLRRVMRPRLSTRRECQHISTRRCGWGGHLGLPGILTPVLDRPRTVTLAWAGVCAALFVAARLPGPPPARPAERSRRPRPLGRAAGPPGRSGLHTVLRDIELAVRHPRDDGLDDPDRRPAVRARAPPGGRLHRRRDGLGLAADHRRQAALRPRPPDLAGPRRQAGLEVVPLRPRVELPRPWPAC